VLEQLIEMHGKPSALRVDNGPGGHFKFPHLWPGQIPPLDSGGTGR